MSDTNMRFFCLMCDEFHYNCVGEIQCPDCGTTAHIVTEGDYLFKLQELMEAKRKLNPDKKVISLTEEEREIASIFNQSEESQ